MAKAVQAVDKMLLVVIRNADAASQAAVRQFVSDVYAHMWDDACLQDKRLLDIRVLMPAEG
jgi:hypothetical protein